MKILVLGASGMLGATLVPTLESCGHEVRAHGGRANASLQADLGELSQTARLLDAIEPQVVVNLVALADVEHCESHPQEAYRANVRSVENVAAWMKGAGGASHLIQLSSDQVYDGMGPHHEGQASPANYYALSKYAGELAALSVGATVLRTNFIGRSQRFGRTSLSDWLYRGLQEHKPIQVFEDALFSPLCMQTLSEMMERVARVQPSGVFNLGSHNGMSKADFAFAFAHALGLASGMLSRSRSAAVLKTYRPKDMRMDSLRFEQGLQVQLPLFSDEIKRCAKDYCGST